ncbi:MAG: nucleotidyltransferase family protein, partial [Candidatus Aenigmatarchaeota archaeon]
MIETAFILCGGEGKRLKPLTTEIPKVLLPIQGKPILEYNIELMKSNGIRNIVLGTGHFGDQIKNYFDNGKNFGVNITYSHEKETLGTGGALRLASKHMKKTFIMCNGDELKEVNINKMYEKHKQNNAHITIA